MPLAYDSAPTLVDNLGRSDVPGLMEMIYDVRRSTPVAQFASKFRSRRTPVAGSLGRQLLAVYRRYRGDGALVGES